MVAISLLALLGSGCAFTEHTVMLPTATSAGISSGGDDRVVVLPPFIDQRDVRTRIGMKKNNFQMDTANVYANQDINAWLGIRLGKELKSSGFKVQEEGTGTKAIRIQGHTLKLFIEPVVQWTTVDMETDLSVRIVVARGDGFEAERTYFVKGLSQALAGTGQNYDVSLNNATDSLMKRLVADLINLLNRYP